MQEGDVIVHLLRVVTKHCSNYCIGRNVSRSDMYFAPIVIFRVWVSIFARLPGQLVGNSDVLRAGGSGVRTSVGEIFRTDLHTP